MNWHRVAYIFLALGKNLASVRGFTAFFSVFAPLYAIVEYADRFAPSMSDEISGLWWLFLLLGALLAGWLCWPKLHTECSLDGRDVSIEIRIGDLFRTPGSLIVGTNTTFDTRIGPGMIEEASVQGQFTRRHYGTPEALDVVLNDALKREQALSQIDIKHLTDGRSGKTERYPIGTTVRLEPKGAIAYLFAMADMTTHFTAVTTPNDVSTSLAKLWNYIGDRGTQSVLASPVIGSKYGQMTLTREKLIQIMIGSFIAACSWRTFCERLIIVVSDADARRYKIDMKSLEAYLQHVCKYADREDHTPAVGTPVGNVTVAEASATEIVAVGSSD